MTRNRLDLMFQHAGDLALDVQWADLGDYRRGDYCRATNVIRLNNSMTAAQVTSTLAHEIGHAELGHSCSSPANERAAWEFGAALAITPREYEMAERLVGCHPGALAFELGVTRPLILAWRRWYTRRMPLERLATSRAVIEDV